MKDSWIFCQPARIIINSLVAKQSSYSLSFLPRIESELAIAKTVNLYLDNETAGKKATQKTLDNHPHAKDWAQIVYPHNKDFNEFLIAL